MYNVSEIGSYHKKNGETVREHEIEKAYTQFEPGERKVTPREKRQWF